MVLSHCRFFSASRAHGRATSNSEEERECPETVELLGSNEPEAHNLFRTVQGGETKFFSEFLYALLT
jgi:hypothetical protein